jgi:hypothetical protein
MNILVGVSEKGLRVGEYHPNAKLTNREVDTLRDLHESGYGYRRLAKMFDIGITTARKYVKCELRSQCVHHFKTVRIDE